MILGQHDRIPCFLLLENNQESGIVRASRQLLIILVSLENDHEHCLSAN